MLNAGAALAVPPREPEPLTARQLEVLAFLRSFVARHGYAPSLREIGTALSIASTNGVNDHIRALARKGYVERDRMRARSIRLRPETSPAELATVPPPPKVIEVVTGRMRVEGAAAVAYFDAGERRVNATLVCAAFQGLRDGDVVSITFHRAAHAGGQESR